VYVRPQGNGGKNSEFGGKRPVGVCVVVLTAKEKRLYEWSRRLYAYVYLRDKNTSRMGNELTDSKSSTGKSR